MSGVPAIGRASSVLQEVSRIDGSSLAALSATLGLAKSSLSDLTSSLVAHGLLVRDSAGRFHLGPTIDRLAAAWTGGTAVLARFGRECDAHRVLEGETVLLLVPDGAVLRCVAVRLGTRPLPQTPRVGMGFGLSDTVPGRELLRRLPAAHLERMLHAASSRDGAAGGHLDAIRSAAARLRAPGITPDDGGAVATAAPSPAGDGWMVAAAPLPGASPRVRAEVVGALGRLLGRLGSGTDA